MLGLGYGLLSVGFLKEVVFGWDLLSAGLYLALGRWSGFLSLSLCGEKSNIPRKIITPLTLNNLNSIYCGRAIRSKCVL